MRTLELTNEEIELIKKALGHMYLTRLDIVKANRNLLEDDAINSILKTANECEDLNCEISEGEKDV